MVEGNAWQLFQTCYLKSDQSLLLEGGKEDSDDSSEQGGLGDSKDRAAPKRKDAEPAKEKLSIMQFKSLRRRARSRLSG